MNIIDEETRQKLNNMHVGRLIRILSHSMRRHNPAEMIENKDLTSMQKHVLKFILLETIHRDLYQKDIEEDEAAMIRGIPKEDVELCKQVLWQMCANRKKMCNKKDSNYKK